MEYENSFRETIKSVAAADSYRIKGNAFYKQRTFDAALVEYNKSLCCAPAKSKELGLAYANRSSIYCEVRMYQKCVENIKLARENNYPGEKMKTLDDREQKCLKLIKSGLRDVEFDVWDFFKLSYKANKRIPFIIDGLELAENEKYGRMIVTTRDLKAGNIIAIEEPAFKVLDEIALKYRCSYCLKNNHYSLIPCEKCPKVMYCSKTCLDKDVRFHQMECPKSVIGSEPTMCDKFVTGATRILKSEAAVFDLVKERKARTVFDFDLSKPEAADHEKKILEIVNALCNNVTYGTNFSTNDSTLKIRQYFLKILNSNSFQLGEYSYEKKADGKFYFDFTKLIGGGLCAFASLFNHSCYPNVVHTIVEGKLVFIVARPIAAGEQLFVSYGPKYSTDIKVTRKARLQHYGFDCDCVACVNDYPIITKLPRTDPKFVQPKILTATRNAISQFRENCKYINENLTLPPSFEVAFLFDHNQVLLSCIARRSLNDSDEEYADFTPPINLSNYN